MRFLELYTSAQDDFEKNGHPLVDASAVSLHPRINEPARINFRLPINSRDRKKIKCGAVVKVEGQLYVITATRKGSDNGRAFLSALGTKIFWVRCAKHHLPQKFKIGAEAGAILEAAFSGISYGKNQIRMLTADELAKIGLEPVTERTDIDRDKINPLEVLEVVMSHLGGELYVDNFTFALVKELGRDTNAVFSLDSSARGVERIEDETEIVTRLYPYGRNNVESTNANGGQMFIESPYIGDFPFPREGTIDFSDIERPADLLRVASRHFLPENYFRIDKPKITYRVNAVDLWKCEGNNTRAIRLKIGDYARVIDTELDFDARVRVVALEEYPFEPRNSVITLGDPPRFIVDVIDDMEVGNSFFWKPKINLPSFNFDDIFDDIFNKFDELDFGKVPIWRRFPSEEDEPPDDGEELPDGVYDISHLKRMELIREDDWREKVSAGDIDRDVDYRIPYAGEFEDAVTRGVIAVLERLGVSVG